MTKSTAPFASVLLGLAVVALAGCERAPEAPAGDAPIAQAPAPQLSADTGAIDATAVVERGSAVDAAGDFDAKAFAGTFAAPGFALALSADGTYVQTVHAESADADLVSRGTWSVEAAGTVLLLDPDSKAEPDRRFTIVSRDEVAGPAGAPVLRRDGA